MTQKLSRNLYRAGIVLSFLIVNAAVLYGIGSIWSYLNTGADRSSILKTGVKAEKLYVPSIDWDTTSYEGRIMEPQSLKEIERDYLNAWYVKNLAYKNNEVLGIDDYYTDSARVNIYRTIAFNKEADLNFESTSLEHHPKLNFYSADGQMVVFKDRNVLEYTHNFEQDTFTGTSVDTASYQVMMLLEDGFWRIRHLKRLQPELTGIDTSLNPEWQVKGRSVYLRDSLYSIKGINYYPKETPWDMYGDEFDIQVIERDFELIRSANLNTVRIFIPYEGFGKNKLVENKLEKLEKVLNVAEAQQLKVILTFFDFYGDYSVLGWTQTHSHARKLLKRFKDHPAIMAFDIKNEPDLDFDNRGKDLVTNWLRYTIDQFRRVVPGKLVTIGWAKPENAHLLKEEVDMISFHYYGDPSDFENIYTRLSSKISKPLILEEFGISSYDGIWKPFSGDEEEQALYHQKMQAFLAKEKLAFLSWTLYDFKEIPGRVVGPLPWRRAFQKEFGFFDYSGNPKPAFKYISN